MNDDISRIPEFLIESCHTLGLNEQELRRLLIEQHASQRLGLVWEHDLIARDKALNADVVLPRLDPALSCQGDGASAAATR